MAVIGEHQVTGSNGRNLSGGNVLIFFMEGFWPGDNCRIIAGTRHFTFIPNPQKIITRNLACISRKGGLDFDPVSIL
jgi:hypothetical protein